METAKKNNQLYITYITDNINELKLSHRKELLQLIIYSNLNDESIVEKGNGTQIKFSDIDNNLLFSIYNFVHKKIESSEVI
jgi:hypothetical protein